MPGKGTKVPIGFLGLAALLSDPDELIQQAEREARLSRGPATPQQTSPPPQQASARQGDTANVLQRERAARSRRAAARTSGASLSPRTRKAALGLTILGGIAILVILASRKGGVSSQPTAPYGSRTVVPYEVTDNPPLSPFYAQPSVGINYVLSAREIRYCLAEDIRLEAGRAVIAAGTPAQITEFNSYINDYNSRCGNYRYRQSDMETARADVELNRAALAAEGRARFR